MAGLDYRKLLADGKQQIEQPELTLEQLSEILFQSIEADM